MELVCSQRTPSWARWISEQVSPIIQELFSSVDTQNICLAQRFSKDLTNEGHKKSIALQKQLNTTAEQW